MLKSKITMLGLDSWLWLLTPTCCSWRPWEAAVMARAVGFLPSTSDGSESLGLSPSSACDPASLDVHSWMQQANAPVLGSLPPRWDIQTDLGRFPAPDFISGPAPAVSGIWEMKKQTGALSLYLCFLNESIKTWKSPRQHEFYQKKLTLAANPSDKVASPMEAVSLDSWDLEWAIISI